jgi:hypothetical protein
LLFALVFAGAEPLPLMEPQQEPRLITFEEYVKCSHEVPYVIQIAQGEGMLLYFGARHSFNFSDPQISQIVELWEKFKPTLSFNEGGDPPTLKAQEEAVRRFGEPGLVRFLAARDSVPVKSLEPALTDQVALLRKHYNAEQVKAFYVLRQIPQFRAQQRDDSIEDYLESLLGGFSDPALDGVIRSRAEFEKTLARVLPQLSDWREVPQEWFDPARPEKLAYTNDISRSLSEFRDRHMIDLLVGAVRRGERAFAVVGASHVVMQEPALWALLDQNE